MSRLKSTSVINEMVEFSPIWLDSPGEKNITLPIESTKTSYCKIVYDYKTSNSNFLTCRSVRNPFFLNYAGRTIFIWKIEYVYCFGIISYDTMPLTLNKKVQPLDLECKNSSLWWPCLGDDENRSNGKREKQRAFSSMGERVEGEERG